MTVKGLRFIADKKILIKMKTNYLLWIGLLIGLSAIARLSLFKPVTPEPKPAAVIVTPVAMSPLVLNTPKPANYGGFTLPSSPTPRQATGPLRLNPANSHYFTDGSGKAIYLAGSHTWLNLQDGVLTDPPPAFDYTKYLDFLQNNNHNFFRLYTWEQSKWVAEVTAPYYFSPMPYLRTGPGVALDDKPKFDLTRFDQRYFDRMRQRVQQAGDRGIYVAVMLFNGWSIDDKGLNNNPWLGHPYNQANNMNGIDGDLNHDNQGNEIHTLANPTITARQEAYVRKVIDTVNDLDNVLYEISNESDVNSTDWQYHMINYVKSYEAGKPKQHPVGMTAQYLVSDDYTILNTILFNSPADWISPANANGYKDDPPVDNHGKVIIADTDHLWGIGGDRQWVWKSFMRGINPIFMDQYDDSYKLSGGGYIMNNVNDVSLRQNLGYTVAYAQRMNLAATTPRNDLSSTNYCLANLTPGAAEYLVYLLAGGNAIVNLTDASGGLDVEWFNPETGVTVPDTPTTGGANRSFNAPFTGDAVLYIHQTPSHQLFVPIVGSGKVSIQPMGPYTDGQVITLTANPAPGWNFVGWQGVLSGDNNPQTFAISSNTVITANFANVPNSQVYLPSILSAPNNLTGTIPAVRQR